MDCKQCENLLSLYLEDELTPQERMSVEEHLNSCPSCAELFSFVQDTGTALATFPEVDVSQNLINSLYDIPVQKKRFSFGLDFLLRPALQPVLAGVSIFLMLLSFYIFHPDKSIIDKTINMQIHRGYSKIGQLYTKAESFAVALFDQKDSLLDSLKTTKLFRGKEE